MTVNYINSELNRSLIHLLFFWILKVPVVTFMLLDDSENVKERIVEMVKITSNMLDRHSINYLS